MGYRSRKRLIVVGLALVVVAVAVVGLPTIAPSVWDEAKRKVQASLGTIGDAIGPIGDVRGEQVPESALRGPARIIDGDTLVVQGSRVRLHGIDAPESDQSCRRGGRAWPCGHEATRALSRCIGSRAVACKAHARDRYGRVIAVCRVGGKDVNAWMVAEGWAFAYRRYSKRYVSHETAARKAKRGIWRGEVIAPWEWRGGKRFADTRSKKAECGKCCIKGKVSKSKERIYHVPGGRYYDQTRINPSKGERWFCSEDQAREAGWRRSRR